MFFSSSRSLPTALLFAGLSLGLGLELGLGLTPAFSQTPDPKAAEKAKAPEPPKEAVEVKRPDGPAGNPECHWFGTRILGRLAADDLDTAFRHMDLYDRFGCPGGHVQSAFRCVVKQGKPDPKTGDINKGIEACWANPLNPAPVPTANAAAAPGTSSQ